MQSSIFSRIFSLLVASQLIVSRVALALPVGEPPAEGVASLSRGQVLSGEITSGADFDRATIAPARFGDRIFALLNSAGPLDPIMQLFDPAGNSVFYNDDGGPPADAFSDSAFFGERMPFNGSAILQADGFGSSTGLYDLYQVILGPNENVNEVEPNDSIDQAMPVQSAEIRANGGSDPDFYSFYANAKEKIVIFVDNDPVDRTDKELNPIPPPAPTPNFDVNRSFSSEMTVFAPDGTTIISGGTFGPKNDKFTFGNAVGAIPAPSTGKYFVRITKAASTNDHPYALVVMIDGDTAPQGACCFLSSCSVRTSLNCLGNFRGVGTSCTGDSDGDGVANDCDNCGSISNALQADSDGDESGDDCEACSTDSSKINPGQCGCGTSDLDSDADGTANCNDLCPSDATRTNPGTCGCGAPNVDANSNGILDCEFGSDLKSQLNSLTTLLKSFKPLAGNANAAKKKAQAAKIAKIKGILDSLGSVQSNLVPLTLSGFDLGKALSSMRRSAGTALRARGKAFSTNKNSALTQLNNLLRVVA